VAKRLMRDRRDAILGGVASGYGDYFDIDPVLVRLGFILLCFLNGVGVIFYLVSWIIMPVRDEGDADTPLAGGAAPADGAVPPSGSGIGAQTERVVDEVRQAGERVIADVRRSSRGGGSGSLVAGFVLILIGMIFLADRIPWLHWPHWISTSGLWPLILIGAGFAMLLGARRGGRG